MAAPLQNDSGLLSTSQTSVAKDAAAILKDAAMPALNTHPLAVEARQIAKAAGLVIFERPHSSGTVFQVSRKLPDGRITHLGHRGTPEALRTYVAKLAAAH